MCFLTGCIAVVAWAWISQAHVQPDVLYLAAGLALVTLAVGVGHDAHLRPWIASGLLVAATTSAVLGLLQYFGASARLHPWVNVAPAGEAYANLRQPNQFATLCAIGMALALWDIPRLPRAGKAALILLFAVASAASVSRTGALQIVLLLGLSVIWKGGGQPDRRRLCTAAVFAYMAAAWGLPLLLQLLSEEPSRTLWERMAGQATCHSRMVLWANVIKLIGERPLVGWGWGELDYAHFMHLYPGARFCEILDNAHSLPLHLAVELGAPIAVLICAGAFAWCWRQRPWRDTDPQRQQAWAVIAVVLFHSLLEYPLWYGPFQIALGTSLGWLMVGVHPTRDRGTRTALATGSIALCMLVMTAGAAWDYWRVSQVYLPPQERRVAWRDDPLAEGKRSWLFASQARFAELTLTVVRREHASATADLAREMLHYSPEPRVVERLIEADTMLGDDREAVLMLARFRAAFPGDYESWRQESLLATHAAPGS